MGEITDRTRRGPASFRGRPIRRQNKSALSLWFRPCASSHSSPVVVAVVVVVIVVVAVVIIDLEFDLNTSYLNYLVL